MLERRCNGGARTTIAGKKLRPRERESDRERERTRESDRERNPMEALARGGRRVLEFQTLNNGFGC